MKLRNRKTGEIREVKNILIDGMFSISSLAELNEEWEDAPEEEVWYLGEEIGNYALPKEEARKITKKILAWKRLKEKGFKFMWVDKHIGSIKFGFFNSESKITKEMWQDIDLLFGGKK